MARRTTEYSSARCYNCPHIAEMKRMLTTERQQRSRAEQRAVDVQRGVRIPAQRRSEICAEATSFTMAYLRDKLKRKGYLTMDDLTPTPERELA